MIITVYSNWREEETISAREFEKKVAEKWDDVSSDEDLFAEWLCDNYSTVEIFNFDDKDKAKVNEEWDDHSREYARTELLEEDGWCEISVEV